VNGDIVGAAAIAAGERLGGRRAWLQESGFEKVEFFAEFFTPDGRDGIEAGEGFEGRPD